MNAVNSPATAPLAEAQAAAAAAAAVGVGGAKSDEARHSSSSHHRTRDAGKRSSSHSHKSALFCCALFDTQHTKCIHFVIHIVHFTGNRPAPRPPVAGAGRRPIKGGVLVSRRGRGAC